MGHRTLLIMMLFVALFLSACADTASAPSASPTAHTMPMGEEATAEP
ncbi:MAG: hypothetical protein H0T73_13435, partial [Ardenticatenales bacterium]|nr:hypothetical protein [Ardenticatenales bacterium]